MKNEKLKLGLQIAQIIILLILVVQVYSLNANLKLNKGTQVNDVPIQANNPAQNSPPKANAALDMKTLADDDPFKGDANAPVTIVEWSDFQCPFCSRFYKDTLSQIEEKYVKTGKVKLVYRDFPLSFHPFAQKAAEAAECANEHGKFWEMHDKIFDNQATLSIENLKTWAGVIGLDTGSFNDCLDSGKMAGEVQKDLNDGTSAGIRGTPGFIINGVSISGAQPYANFEAAIEAALNR